MYKYGKYNVYYFGGVGVKGYSWIIHKKSFWGWREFMTYDSKELMEAAIEELKRSGNTVIPA